MNSGRQVVQTLQITVAFNTPQNVATAFASAGMLCCPLKQPQRRQSLMRSDDPGLIGHLHNTLRMDHQFGDALIKAEQHHMIAVVICELCLLRCPLYGDRPIDHGLPARRLWVELDLLHTIRHRRGV